MGNRFCCSQAFSFLPPAPAARPAKQALQSGRSQSSGLLSTRDDDEEEVDSPNERSVGRRASFSSDDRRVGHRASCSSDQSPKGDWMSCTNSGCLEHMDSELSGLDSLRGGRVHARTKYVGAYSRLAGFIRDCHRREIICASSYRELMTVLESLNDPSAKRLSSHERFFRGSEKDFAEVLPAMGISVSMGLREVQPLMRGGSKGFTSSYSGDPAKNQIPVLLQDLYFNSRERGHIKADARMLSNAIATAPTSATLDMEGYLGETVDIEALGLWIESIASQYMKTPYHSWTHAVDVFQFLYLSLYRGEDDCGWGWFTARDLLALLTASLAHDAGHPGLNNAFLVTTGAPLAIMYNDISPLEHMHASTFFETLRQPGTNFVHEMSRTDYNGFRTKVIDAILATDMAHHFDLVDRLTMRMSKSEQGGSNPFIRDEYNRDGTGHKTGKDDRKLLLQVFMHAADLGHSCRPWDVHKAFVVDLEEELFRQGDEERHLGLPIMPMMDRTKDSAASGQGFFLTKIVFPHMDPFSKFISSEVRNFFQENLQRNRQLWAALVDKHGKRQACELVPLSTELPLSPLGRRKCSTVRESSGGTDAESS